ncbi:MAG: alpha/beta fold hydrolase, partial [Acidobacteria bacterium]
MVREAVPTPIPGPLPDVPDFDPGPLLRQPDVQTIATALRPAPAVGPPRRVLEVPVEDEKAVRVLVNEPAGAPPRGTVLLVHGLAGAADSSYMCWTAVEALARGWTVARMVLRGCDGTIALSRSLHNAAQSDDVERVLEALRGTGLPGPFAAIGFSLGASLVLRATALAGEAAASDIAVGVNPPVDLALCAEALERPRNLHYRVYFMRRLCRMLEESRRTIEVPGPPARLWRVRSIRQFDDLYTAPMAGFRDALDYYRRASVGPVLDRIRRPALVLCSRDDPLIPERSFDGIPRRRGSVLCRLVRHGGHVGYR